MPTISGAKSGITARKVTRLTRAEFRSWMKDEGGRGFITKSAS